MSTNSMLNAIQHEGAVDFVFVEFEDQGTFEELMRVRLQIDKREQLAAVVARVASEHFPGIATEFNDYHVDLATGTYQYFGFRPSDAESLNFRPRIPSYYLAADGSAFTALGLPITLEMVESSVEAELARLHLDEIYIYPPLGGRGATGEPFQDLVLWLLDHGVDLGFEVGAVWGLSSLFKRIRGGRTDRRARRIAHDWARSGFRYPYTLRHFLDQRDAWSIDELSKRLRIGNRIARDLLKAAGYEEVEGKWRLGSTYSSRRRRRKWLRSEHDTL